MTTTAIGWMYAVAAAPPPAAVATTEPPTTRGMSSLVDSSCSTSADTFRGGVGRLRGIGAMVGESYLRGKGGQATDEDKPRFYRISHAP